MHEHLCGILFQIPDYILLWDVAFILYWTSCLIDYSLIHEHLCGILYQIPDYI